MKWKAIYNNGTELNEAPSVGYHEIDRTQLRFFQLLDNDTIKINVEFTGTERLIWRRRVAIHSNRPQEVVHIVGKQTTVNGENHQWIALLFESDGRVEFFDRFNPNHPFLREVKLLEYEL